MGFIIDLGRYIGGVLTLGLAATFSGVALLPAWWLFTQVDERLGRAWAVATTPFGYVLWGFSLCALIVAYKRLTFYKARPGSFHIFTWPIVQWGITGYLTLFAHAVFVQFLKGTPWINWWYRGLGARVGRRVNIQTTFVHDWDLLEIGDDVTLGGESAVLAHVFEADQIKLMPVRIGRGASLGRSSVIFPGCTVGERTAIGANSLVPKGRTLESHSVYVGAPVRLLRRRGERDRAPDDPLNGADDNSDEREPEASVP